MSRWNVGEGKKGFSNICILNYFDCMPSIFIPFAINAVILFKFYILKIIEPLKAKFEICVHRPPHQGCAVELFADDGVITVNPPLSQPVHKGYLQAYLRFPCHNPNDNIYIWLMGPRLEQDLFIHSTSY